jgi:hypothetical protein
MPRFGVHAVRRSRHEIPQVLASPWNSIFEDHVYKVRSRRRASYLDTIEPVVRFLAATGQLSAYAKPGIDPLAVIQAAAETGANE